MHATVTNVLARISFARKAASGEEDYTASRANAILLSAHFDRLRDDWVALRSGGRKQGPAGYHLKTLVLQHLLDGHDFTSVHLCGLEHNPKTPIANHLIS